MNSLNSGNLINHASMNWAQFKDPVSHLSCWHCGSILVSYTKGGWVAANSVKTFRDMHREHKIVWAYPHKDVIKCPIRLTQKYFVSVSKIYKETKRLFEIMAEAYTIP